MRFSLKNDSYSSDIYVTICNNSFNCWGGVKLNSSGVDDELSFAELFSATKSHLANASHQSELNLIKQSLATASVVSTVTETFPEYGYERIRYKISFFPPDLKNNDFAAGEPLHISPRVRIGARALCVLIEKVLTGTELSPDDPRLEFLREYQPALCVPVREKTWHERMHVYDKGIQTGLVRRQRNLKCFVGGLLGLGVLVVGLLLGFPGLMLEVSIGSAVVALSGLVAFCVMNRGSSPLVKVAPIKAGIYKKCAAIYLKDFSSGGHDDSGANIADLSLTPVLEHAADILCYQLNLYGFKVIHVSRKGRWVVFVVAGDSELNVTSEGLIFPAGLLLSDDERGQRVDQISVYLQQFLCHHAPLLRSQLDAGGEAAKFVCSVLDAGEVVVAGGGLRFTASDSVYGNAMTEATCVGLESDLFRVDGLITSPGIDGFYAVKKDGDGGVAALLLPIIPRLDEAVVEVGGEFEVRRVKTRVGRNGEREMLH